MLGAQPHRQTLQRLQLAGNNTGAGGAAHADASWASSIAPAVARSSLTAIDLRDNALDMDGAMALAPAIGRSLTLHEVDQTYTQPS